MEKKSIPEKEALYHKLSHLKQKGVLPEKLEEYFLLFLHSYEEAMGKERHHAIRYCALFDTFLDLVVEQNQHPFAFELYHEAIRSPFDYYAFGLDFFRPLVEKKRSPIRGIENLKEIATALAQKNNVILFANHQTEADPQAFSLLLEDLFPQIGEQTIFVAGERVLVDPIAAPMSMGRNLLCIYSKRYIDTPPENKLEKQLHNKKTMQLMSQLLSTGGKCIYVAPSGGRDRPNAEGIVQLAPFDPQSIEMFYLMTKKAHYPTHFYPMALATYDLLPPPETIQKEFGEKRVAKRAAIHVAFGQKINMEYFPGTEITDKRMRRKARADHIWNLVHDDYKRILAGE